MFIATNVHLTKGITEYGTSDAKLHATITDVQESGNSTFKRKEQTMIQIDMDMPSKCEDCPMELSDEYEWSHECVLLYKGYTSKVRTFGRLAECPLKGADDDMY